MADQLVIRQIIFGVPVEHIVRARHIQRARAAVKTVCHICSKCGKGFQAWPESTDLTCANCMWENPAIRKLEREWEG